MKIAEVQSKVLAGVPVIVGKYLQTRAETVRYMDKKTKQPASFDKLVHIVMTQASGPVVVDVDTRKIAGFSPETYKSPFKDGEQVAVVITSCGTNGGMFTARGEVHPLVTG